MNALILCAGEGNRLGKLTNDTPKPMIEVAGKPVLEHIIDHLLSHNIDEIVINTHYKPDKIYKHFGNSISYLYEPVLLGDYVTTHKVIQFLGGTGLVMNGDTLTDIDISEMVHNAKHWEKSSIASFEEMRYTGTTLYWDHKPVVIKQYGCYWQDIGTPEGLEKARKHYEDTPRMPKLS